MKLDRLYLETSSSCHCSTRPGGGEDQHPIHHLAQEILLQHQPGLNRLAQPHFVGQQPPPTKLAQHHPGRPNLVVEGGEVDGVQGQEVIETGHQLQPVGHQLELVEVQICPLARAGRGENLLRAGQQTHFGLDGGRGGARGRS